MYCTKCGKEIKEEALFCTFCGQKVIPTEVREREVVSVNERVNESVSVEANKKIALIICIVAGALLLAVVIMALVSDHDKYDNEGMSVTTEERIIEVSEETEEEIVATEEEAVEVVNSEEISSQIWYDAYNDQLPTGLLSDNVEDTDHQYLAPVKFCDLNNDKIPEIYLGTLAANYFIYLDKEMKLHEDIIGDIVWVKADKSFIAKSIAISVDNPYDYTTYEYDENSGIYQKGNVLYINPDSEYINSSYNDDDFEYLNNAKIKINDTDYESLEEALTVYCAEYAEVTQVEGNKLDWNIENSVNNFESFKLAEVDSLSKVSAKLQELAGISKADEKYVVEP